MKQRKSKFLAAIMALIFGTFGIHRFYLGEGKTGFFYIMLYIMTSTIFSPTIAITTLLGIFDFFRLMTMGQSEFDRRYNQHIPIGQQRGRRTNQRNAYPRQRTKVEPVSAPKAKKSFRPKVNPYKKTALKRYEEYDTEEAVKELHKALEIEPNNQEYLFKLACAYSQLEQTEKSIQFLDLAIRNGYKDVDKINTIEDLAYLRISPEFAQFVDNQYSLKTVPKLSAPKENLLDNDLILSQLNKLVELKKRGLLSETEYAKEKQKLLNK